MVVFARPDDIESAVAAAKNWILPEFFNSEEYLPLVSFSLSVKINGCFVHFVVVVSSLFFSEKGHPEGIADHSEETSNRKCATEDVRRGKTQAACRGTTRRGDATKSRKQAVSLLLLLSSSGKFI